METIAVEKEVGKKTQTLSGAEAVILSLIEEQTEFIFGYPGGAIMPIYDALYGYTEQVQHVLTRHEQGAIHAAQGYARVTNRPGVVFATSGPGATNLITGLADAKIDSTPLVCITGQVPFSLLGTDAFQETDVISLSMPVTKWNFQVTKPEDIPGAIAKAFYIATSGRPGPVLIDITKDAQFADMEYSYKKCTGFRSYIPKPPVDIEKIKQAAELINAAKRPYILFGQGVILSEAEEELATFVEKTGIPAAWTIMGLSAMPTDHPLNVGMLGMHGNYGPNKLTNECDVLIAVGMRFDDRVTGNLSRYAKQAKVVHLEIDPAEIDKNVQTDVAVLGDAKESLRLLAEHCNTNEHSAWLDRFKEYSKIEYDKVIRQELQPEKEGLSMGEVIRRINELTDGDAVVVTDVGQHQMVTCRYAHFKKTKSNITSGGLGTMGFCLPAALGAKLGAKQREVIAVIGDGGFQMTLQELGTIFQTQAAVKIVILNNQFLGMVRQWQQMFFDKRYSSTELINPDFVAIARGFGIEAATVKERNNLDGAVNTMFDHDGPYLLEVMVEKEDNVFPMVPSGASVDEIRLE
ncbi:biosynthetic-type acetolactate synthase large subunit [Fulvivirga sp. M361]|uniref:biosynthetic-type acetolactate synthase large subunit n=1 Tax=Fulvivirga sp. M361 TaxID=2594266 RepID=UPI00117A2BDC|nr:biosynthetic-type acetolactate synthase large subunit [Fulvivirga sp. M361]TRX61809.1 biosynthetic-type acetolactate synthase large subunit [Fulvivirga sp. M361]